MRLSGSFMKSNTMPRNSTRISSAVGEMLQLMPQACLSRRCNMYRSPALGAGGGAIGWAVLELVQREFDPAIQSASHSPQPIVEVQWRTGQGGRPWHWWLALGVVIGLSAGPLIDTCFVIRLGWARLIERLVRGVRGPSPTVASPRRPASLAYPYN